MFFSLTAFSTQAMCGGEVFNFFSVFRSVWASRNYIRRNRPRTCTLANTPHNTHTDRQTAKRADTSTHVRKLMMDGWISAWWENSFHPFSSRRWSEVSSHYKVRNGIPNPSSNGIPLRNQSWQELRQGDQPALITKSLDVAPSSKSSSSHDNRRSEVAQPHLSGFEPRLRPASIIINLFSSKYIHKRVASAGRAPELRHFTRSSSFRWGGQPFSDGQTVKRRHLLECPR